MIFHTDISEREREREIERSLEEFISHTLGSMSRSSVFFTTFTVALVVALGTVVAPQAEARAFFVFGDSLVDSGNNNYLVTTARADSPPYGIDYPTHRPTGRFSNGLNIPDLISRLSILLLYIWSH